MEKKIIFVTICFALLAVVSSELHPAKCTGEGCSVEHQLRSSGEKRHPPPSSRPYKVQKTAVRPKLTPGHSRPTTGQPKPTPGQPKPTPGHPRPTPGQPKPTPGHPKPTLGQPKPTPGHPRPTPGQPKPRPGHSRPTPGQPKPTPGHPKPTLGQPKPTPGHPRPTPGQPKPTPGQPRPTPGQPKPTPDRPMWSFKSPADKVSFLGSFYRLVLDIHQTDKMRHNLTTDKAKNRTSLQKEMEVQLSKLIHRLFEKTLHGAKLMAHSILSNRDLAEINDKKQQEFALFEKTVLSRLKGNFSFAWKDMVISRKLKWANSTRYDGFIRENLRNVSHAFQVILNGWLKKRPTSHIEHMAYMKRPCLKDCKKLREIFAFCKAQHQECSNDERRDQNGVKKSASVKRPKPSEEAYETCTTEKKRCPLQYQCVPKYTPCIDDRDIFKDGGDDVTAGRLPGILSKASRDGVLRTPRLQPSMGLPGGLNEREREILKKAGIIDVARLRSLMDGVMPTAVHDALRKIRPSVMPGWLSKLKDQRNGNRSHAISPTRSSSESFLNMDHNCSSLCSNKNMSFCWAEMRCKKRGTKCGIKHLIQMMNSTNIGQSPNCQSGEFFCPIFMKCTKTRMECDPKQFYKLCGSNETCRPRNESRGLNASEIEDEDKIFRLRCRVGRKYCPERSGCVNRNDSCSDGRKLGFPSLKDAANEKKIHCRLSDFICPRLYSYWRVMHVGCRKALNDSDYRKRDNTHEREVLKSLRPKPSVIRPSASSSCTKKMILVSDGDVEVNEQFEISVKVEGFSSLRHASCSLHGPTGQSSVKELGQHKARILTKKNDVSPAKKDENSCDDSAGSWYLIRYEEVTLKNAGEYGIKCSVDNVMYVVGGRKLKAITTSSSIAGYQPSFIKMGIESTVIVKGSGFQNTSSLSCIAVNEDNFHTSKIKAKFINVSTVACHLPSFKIPGRLQLNVFSSAAVKRSGISKSGPRLDVVCPYPRAVSGDMIKGLRKFQIKLDKRAVYSAVKGKRRFDCRSVFSQNTVAKFGNANCALMGSHIYVNLPVDSKIIQVKNASVINVVINNENLRCQWTKYSRAIGPMLQNIRIKLPKFEIKAVIRGERSIDACDNVILSGSKSIFGDGGKRLYSWKLFEDGAVVSTKEGASFFRVEGSKLKPNMKYKVNLCVRNILGQENCAEHQLTLTSNQPNKIHVRIPGPDSVRILASQRFTVRPAIKFIQCGKRQKTSEMHFMWEVTPNDGVILERKDRRVLTIKPGNLKPQTNYTLYLLVRAVEDKVETAQASVKLQVAGAPLRAKIRGGQEMTVGCYDKIVLDARQSSDPAATREEGKYVWDCLQKGKGSCSKSSNPDERLVLEEKKRVYLNVNGNLECNQSYIFNLTFSKDSRSASASILVKTKPGQPAEVKLDQSVRRNLMILNGFVKTKSPAVVDWSCLLDEGFQYLDLNDESMVRRGRVRAMKVGSKVWRPRLIILLDKLPPNTAFKIRLSAKNKDGESNAVIVVKSASPPEKGDLKVSPSVGTALKTIFTLSADEGWQETVGFKYEYGCIEKGRRGTREFIFKEYDEKNCIGSIQLPPGDEENNSTLTLYVKVKNGQGLWTRATKQVQVKKLDVIESEKVKEIMAESDQAIIEQDYEKANQMIANVLKTAGGDKLVDGVSMKDDLTKKALTILETAAGTDTKMTFPTLELTTKPGSDGALLGAETRKKVANATKNSIVEIPLIVVHQNSKRKRRSAENSEASSAFTPKSKEEVDSVMTIFDNIIDENDTSNLQDDMKANFTATTPSLLRSLCAGLIQSGEFSESNNNLSTLRANRVAGDTFNVNSLNLSDAHQGPTLKLGAYLQQKYEQWNCSDSGLACTELCVGTVLYHHNPYRSDHPNRIADIVNIHLIHPDAYSLVDPGILQSPVQLSMKLNEIPDSNHRIECQTWKSSNWTSEGCATSYKESGYALCNCSSITNLTVFKVAVQPAATTQASTATPSTYTNTEVSDLTAIISASTPPLLETTYISETSVLPRGSEALLTSVSEPASTSMQPTTSTVARPKEPASIQVVFSFPVDYNTYAAAGKADQFKQDIMNMLTTKLHVSKNRILNLEIKPGSIIVSFVLMENNGSLNEDTLSTARTKLEKMAADGSLSITLSDGSVLTADPLSLKFSSPDSHPPPHKKEDSKKSLLLIVVISVLVIVLLFLVFARLYVVHKGRRTKVDPDRPLSARSLVVDTIQLEEKPKPAKMIQDYEETNKSSENLITVGIGSSASLKHSPLPNC